MARTTRRAFLRHIAGLGTLASAPLLGACASLPANAPIALLQPFASPTPANAEAIAAGLSQLPLAPIGIARGIYPGRVAWAHDPRAARWDGVGGAWWQEDNIAQERVDRMLSNALQTVTGQSSDAQAWHALFRHFNSLRRRPGANYERGQQIAIKVNLNACMSRDYAGNGSFVSPAVVYALLRQLVSFANVAPSDITVYDATRYVPDCVFDKCDTPELEGAHFVDWAGGDGREQYARDSDSQITWSADMNGNPAYLPTCVTRADYHINLASLKGHTLAGLAGCAENWLGALLADLDGKPTMDSARATNLPGYMAAQDFDAGRPGRVWPQQPMGAYNPLVDLMSHPHLGGKTLLCLMDGLYVAPHQSAEITNACRWQSSPFRGHWTASLFASQDGVAIDSVALDFLRAEPTVAGLPEVMPANSTADNYLHEAALLGNPPSGTRYHATHGARSLGVHEHWNTPRDRRYSRNLGKGSGIELIRV